MATPLKRDPCQRLQIRLPEFAMNVSDSIFFSPDFRKIESRRVSPQAESSAQRTQQTGLQTRSSLLIHVGEVSASRTAPAVGFKSDVAHDLETSKSDEADKTNAEETVDNASERFDEPDDLSNDYEPTGERSDNDDDPKEETDAQRQRKGIHVNVLEARYRSHFAMLDHLVGQLAAIHDFLTQRIQDPPG